jgi:hypothetical protein
MSSQYYISTNLDVKHNLENILRIIKTGSKMDIEYYKLFDISSSEPLEPLDFNNISIDDGIISVFCIYQKINFILYISAQNEKISLLMPDTYWNCYKKFKTSEDEKLDVVKYIDLFLQLIKEYKILDFKVEKF